MNKDLKEEFEFWKEKILFGNPRNYKVPNGGGEDVCLSIQKESYCVFYTKKYSDMFLGGVAESIGFSLTDDYYTCHRIDGPCMITHQMGVYNPYYGIHGANFNYNEWKKDPLVVNKMMITAINEILKEE